MSAPPHDGWPAEGSRWEHWDDLLLACQLAGLRNGWNGISKTWDDREPTKLVMRCHVGNGSRPSHCQSPVLTAKAEDSTRLEGACLSSPTKHPKIKLDKTVKGFNKLHLIEASLRVEARRSNRFIRKHTQKSTKTDDHLGPYRLLAAGETLETKFPPPDSILTAKLEPLKLSRSETRKSLSTIETTLRNLRSELALADIMEELDETKRLKEALDSAGQEKEQYLAKLAEIEVKMKGVE
ncbi:hypothetical protein JCM16303_005441 [Sporobolomyces ruberrimus]